MNYDVDLEGAPFPPAEALVARDLRTGQLVEVCYKTQGHRYLSCYGVDDGLEAYYLPEEIEPLNVATREAIEAWTVGMVEVFEEEVLFLVDLLDSIEVPVTARSVSRLSESERSYLKMKVKVAIFRDMDIPSAMYDKLEARR